MCVCVCVYVCVCVFASFPLGFEGGWDLIVLILGHCLSIYFDDTLYNEQASYINFL